MDKTRFRLWLVVNAFNANEKFEDLYQLLSEAAVSHDMDVIKMDTADVMRAFDASGRLSDGVEKPDAAVFWDKDTMYAEMLEDAGIRCFNSSSAIGCCDSKALTTLELEKAGVRVPRTVVAPFTFSTVGYTSNRFVEDAVEALGGYPVVLKTDVGSFGSGVHLIHDEGELASTIESISPERFILQEFVETSCGRDVRVNVVGGRHVASMLRRNDEDFRSNISNGGTGEAYDPPETFTEMAVRAAKAVGADWAGVDVMFGEDGKPIVCEVNSNPHFRSTLTACGVNMADLIMEHVRECLERGSKRTGGFGAPQTRASIYYVEGDYEKNKSFASELVSCLGQYGIHTRITLIPDRFVASCPSPIATADMDEIRSSVMEDIRNGSTICVNRSRIPEISGIYESFGFYSINNSNLVRCANDKLYTYEFLSGLGESVLPTVTVKAAARLESPTGRYVVKRRSGHGGSEVYKAESSEKARELIRKLAGNNGIAESSYIVQPMNKSTGHDMRVFVLGDDVLGAIKRTSDVDFRANYSLGGKAEYLNKEDAPAECVETALRVAGTIGGEYLGVDFMPDGDGGWIVNEIEDAANVRTLYYYAGMDVGELLAEFIAKKTGNL